MSRHLADVNVLLALFWPHHEGHAAAHAWFAKSGHRAWATNPITQLGVLRLLTNPAVTQDAVGAPTALRVLSEATSHSGYEFWPLERDLVAGLRPLAGRVRGHQRWTHAVLLGQSADRDGVLVTFDSGVQELSAAGFGDHVLLLKRR